LGGRRLGGFQPLGVEGAWKAPFLGGGDGCGWGERMAWFGKARRQSTAWGWGRLESADPWGGKREAPPSAARAMLMRWTTACLGGRTQGLRARVGWRWKVRVAGSEEWGWETAVNNSNGPVWRPASVRARQALEPAQGQEAVAL
jgi:hypothetical protein